MSSLKNGELQRDSVRRALKDINGDIHQPVLKSKAAANSKPEPKTHYNKARLKDPNAVPPPRHDVMTTFFNPAELLHAPIRSGSQDFLKIPSKGVHGD